MCTFAPGNPMGTCECLPGTVENKHGECVHCIRKYRKYFRGVDATFILRLII